MEIAEQIKRMQEKIDKLYDENGCTSEVLELQVEVNYLRHKHDLPDKSEIVYEDFVQ